MRQLSKFSSGTPTSLLIVGAYVYLCLPWLSRTQWHAFSLYQSDRLPDHSSMCVAKCSMWINVQCIRCVSPPMHHFAGSEIGRLHYTQRSVSLQVAQAGSVGRFRLHLVVPPSTTIWWSQHPALVRHLPLRLQSRMRFHFTLSVRFRSHSVNWGCKTTKRHWAESFVHVDVPRG